MGRRQERARWTTNEGLAKGKAVLQTLLAGEGLGRAGLETIDGRVDLRGFIFPSPVELATLDFESDRSQFLLRAVAGIVELRARLSDVDLTGAILRDVSFVDSDVENCLFDEADCSGLRSTGCHYQDCSFARTDLRDAALGSTHDARRTKYLRVSFRNANLAKAHAIEAHFRDCDFSYANLSSVNFMGSSFERSTFAGELLDVTFYGQPPSIALEHGHDGRLNRMTDVDLRRTKLKFVNFRNLELKHALLPEGPDHAVLTRFTETIAATVSSLRNDPRPSAQRLFMMLSEGELRWALEDQDTGILQLANYDAEEKTLLLSLLAEKASNT